MLIERKVVCKIVKVINRLFCFIVNRQKPDGLFEVQTGKRGISVVTKGYSNSEYCHHFQDFARMNLKQQFFYPEI